MSACLTHLLEKKQKMLQYQRSLQQELSFYWLNLSLQEDSCIAKTEPDESSSAVVIYSLKLHQNDGAMKYWTIKTLKVHYNTLRYGRGEEAAATDSDVRKNREGDVSLNIWSGVTHPSSQVRRPLLNRRILCFSLTHHYTKVSFITCCFITASQC